MAVYTHLGADELATLAEWYGLGEVLEARPIAEGVENSNYLFLTRGERGPQRHILTVYEKRVNPGDLPFFLSLMDHLAVKGLAVPQPLRRADGEMLAPLRGGAKWAALVTFLEGESPVEVRPAHLKTMGEQMAALHAAVDDFMLSRPNDLSVAGWERLAAMIGPRADEISPGLAAEIAKELEYLRPRWPSDLSGDVVHADLFVDNVFFKEKQLSGIIDFYFACHDFFLYDLAIAMNAWCFDGNRFDKARAAALIMAYRANTALPEDEWEYLPLLARGAALRFLLTRAYDWLNRQEGALVMVKDPLEYQRKLGFHQTISHWTGIRRMKHVSIHTDGACSGNPGPGGWGAVLVYEGNERELFGGETPTTNNRMELMAAIQALDALKSPCIVTLHTDSNYVRHGITEWIHGWRRNGWLTADKKPVKNADLWQRLLEASGRHTVEWRWVKGHAGDPMNERADALARRGTKMALNDLKPEA